MIRSLEWAAKARLKPTTIIPSSVYHFFSKLIIEQNNEGWLNERRKYVKEDNVKNLGKNGIRRESVAPKSLGEFGFLSPSLSFFIKAYSVKAEILRPRKSYKPKLFGNMINDSR